VAERAPNAADLLMRLVTVVAECNVTRCYSSLTSDVNEFISLMLTGQINNDNINALCTYVAPLPVLPRDAMIAQYCWIVSDILLRTNRT